MANKQKQYTTGVAFANQLAKEVYETIATKVAGYFAAFPNVPLHKAARDLNLSRERIMLYRKIFQTRLETQEGDDTK